MGKLRLVLVVVAVLAVVLLAPAYAAKAAASSLEDTGTAIKSGSIVLKVADYSKARAEVIRLAEARGASLSSERSEANFTGERHGEIVARIPLGASDAVGSFGLTAGMDELIDQEKALGIRFDAIMVGSSSGGTQAGLEVGKRLFGRSDLRIIGVSPDDPAADIREVVMRVSGQMLDKIGGVEGLNEENIEIDDAHVGEGYGIPSPASEEAARLFAGTEGILLDPVYTSKVGAALIDACRQGLFLPGQNVLFWHTGGLIGLFS